MKIFTKFIAFSLLLCSLLALKTQASIIPDKPAWWDYWVTGTPDPTGTQPTDLYWELKQDPYHFGIPTWAYPGTLKIMNIQNPDKYKIICLELEYWNIVPPNLALPVVDALGTGPANYTVIPVGNPEYGTADVTYKWIIKPQPGAETIQLPINWEIGLKQIDIATKCVPEPSTYFVGLSALGLLGLFSWRNRK
jgi:hypothetical protein